MMPTLRILGFISLSLLLGRADDWPAYRGRNGDGVSAERLPATLPQAGPRLLWRTPTPGGLSSFAIGEGKAFTTVVRTNNGRKEEVCLALDAGTGKELWAAVTGPVNYRGGADSGAPGNNGGDGPRSTPTISSGKVYVYSADMLLSCLEAASGKQVWAKDIQKEFGGKNIGWSSAMSPVVHDDLVYVAGGGAGQAMLAFNKSSGAVVWKAGDAAMTHATPVFVTLHGVPQIVYLMQTGLIALEANTGHSLWTYSFPYRTATACSPVIAGDMVFMTASYEVGGAACRISKNGTVFTASELWRDKGDSPTASLWSTPVEREGYLYGMLSSKKYGRGPLKCVDLKDAAVKWQQPGFGTGQVIRSGSTLIALADDGQVSLVEATPSGYHEQARFKAVEGKCWSTPALCNGRLYVRSTKEGACFDLNTTR